jgi:hypothetical protein
MSWSAIWGVVAPADLIFARKIVDPDGTIVQIRVWRVPEPVRGSTHPFKYYLFYGRPGRRIVGYDNEAGKGDHRHYGDREEPYRFRGVRQLRADFLADVRRHRRKA